MKVRVRLFGAVSERAELEEETIDVPAGSTSGDVLDLVGDRFPATRGLLGLAAVAVNLETAPLSMVLSEDDEVAVLPPVAGGSVRILTGLRDPPPTVEEALSEVADPGAGGTVVFVGTVRDRSENRSVERLQYSAYPEMAERVLRQIAEKAAQKWQLSGAVILHSVGDLRVGQTTIVVACSAAHRSEAFDACRYAIDEVKQRVPIWKKEFGPLGERWVGMEAHSETFPR